MTQLTSTFSLGNRNGEISRDQDSSDLVSRNLLLNLMDVSLSVWARKAKENEKKTLKSIHKYQLNVWPLNFCLTYKTVQV